MPENLATTTSVRRRGFLYSFGIVFNRVVPANWFRFRVFRVYVLSESCSPSDDLLKESVRQDLLVRRCETSHERYEASQITGVAFANGDPRADQHVAWIADVLCESSRPKGLGENGISVEQLAREIVGGLWLASDSFDEAELGIRLLLPDNAHWLFSASVRRDFRQRGLYGRFLAHVLADPSHADRQFLAAINPTNRASMGAHRKFIDRSVGTCIGVRLFGMAWCFATGAVQPAKACSLNSQVQPIELTIEA